MKTKYLFGMLLSGAMLAACTADDLDSALVAQDVNPSAPVFTVSFEGDGDLRGTYSYEKTGVKFDGKDKLSLFHGVTSTNLTDFTGWQNAIYSGEESEDAEHNTSFKFQTNAMVQPGYAIMVYPDDEGFENMGDNNLGNTAPIIKIDAYQTATTKDSIPYISSILDIKKSTTNEKDAQAGYQQDYNNKIVMRRAAMTLDLNMTLDNVPNVEGVDTMRIKSIELKASSATFVTKMKVKPGTAYSARTDYPSWAYPSVLEAVTESKVESLETEDTYGTTNNNVRRATFTMFPSDLATNLSGAQLIIKTNYGVATYDATEEVWILKNGTNGAEKKNNTTDALKYIESALYANAATNSVFKGENTAKRGEARLELSLAGKIKMDNMHITNSEDLLTALKVYDELYIKANSNDEVSLYLDGLDDKTFVMTETAWTEVEAHLKDSKSKVKFIPCTDHDCETVQLISAATGSEVPSLTFADGGNAKTHVELVGKWNYTGVDATTDKDDRKAYTNVQDIVVADGTELTVTGILTASDNAGQKSTVTIENYGIVNISGNVDAKLGITNWKTLNIGANDVLGVTDGAGLTNKAAQATGDHGVGVDGWSEGAVINNRGWLAVKGTGNGSAINNFGIINSYQGARTLVTTNARTNSDLAKVFKGGTNAIGTINIFEPTLKEDNNVVVDNEFKGFIRLEVTTDASGNATIGDVANYIYVKGESAVLNGNNLPDQVNYIQVASSKELKFRGEFNIDGLFLREGVKANIPEGAEVTVNKEIYLKALLSVAGTLDVEKADYAGYHGGKNTDVENIYYTGSNNK